MKMGGQHYPEIQYGHRLYLKKTGTNKIHSSWNIREQVHNVTNIYEGILALLYNAVIEFSLSKYYTISCKSI
jgi:hypothetical protein